MAPFVAVPAPFSKEERILRIGVLGNTYSYSPLPRSWRAVARAADDLGLRGELVFVGQGQAERLRSELGGLISIVSVGHVEEAKAAAVLRGTFLQYLNYPFGWRDRVLRQTSFPSKLATYIAAGRPLLLHTPADSTTAELATIPGLSYHWDDLNLEHGVRLLKQAWDDPQTSLGAHVALEEVRRRYYDPDTIKANVMGMLDAMVGPLSEGFCIRRNHLASVQIFIPSTSRYFGELFKLSNRYEMDMYVCSVLRDGRPGTHSGGCFSGVDGDCPDATGVAF